MRKPKLINALGSVVLLGVGMQFIRPEQINPRSDPTLAFEVTAKPSPKLASIIQRSCNDCHSNQTVWPWYSQIAPGSWLIARDVNKGRLHVNFSEWGRLSPEKEENRIDEICQETRGHSMPPLQYTLLHPGAKLSKDDIDTLCSFPVGK